MNTTTRQANISIQQKKIMTDDDTWMDNSDLSRIMSYFIRWGIRNIFFGNRVSPILIQTDKYIQFLPQLNDSKVANHSILQIQNEFAYRQATQRLRCVSKKQIQLLHQNFELCEKPLVSVRHVFAFVTERVSVDLLKIWLGRNENEGSRIISVIFPAAHMLHFQRMLCEFSNMVDSEDISGPIRGDFLYYGDDEIFKERARLFLKRKLNFRVLTPTDLAFLSQWAYVIFGTRPQSNPRKKPKETEIRDSM